MNRIILFILASKHNIICSNIDCIRHVFGMLSQIAHDVIVNAQRRWMLILYFHFERLPTSLRNRSCLSFLKLPDILSNRISKLEPTFFSKFRYIGVQLALDRDESIFLPVCINYASRQIVSDKYTLCFMQQNQVHKFQNFYVV